MSQSAIDATVNVVENLGNELQSMTCAGKSIIASLDHRSRVVAGNKVRLFVDSDQIHLFDTDTGEAVF